MGIFGKWLRPKRDFMIWSQKLQRFELMKLTWRPGLAEDTFQKKAWELPSDLKTYWIKLGRKLIPVNILDEEKGIGLNIEPNPEILELRTNTELSGQLIDAVMITTAYQLTPSNKKVIIAGVICFLMGLLFGRGM